MMKYTLSIIYVYYNTPREIISSLQSIPQSLGSTSHEIIIVDNNSSKRLPQNILANKKIKIIKNKENVGFSRGVNQAAKNAAGKYLLVVNPDVLFHKNAVSEMVHVLEKDKKIGVIGPQYLDGKHAIVPSVSGMPFLPGAIFSFSVFDKLFPDNYFSKKYWMRNISQKKAYQVPAIGGACMLFRKTAFNKIGGFDERFFLYFEEADIGYRLEKAGYSVLYFPKVAITHLIGRSSENMTTVQRNFERSRFLFFHKYHGLLSALVGEALIRVLQPHCILLIGILFLSLFMNVYKIDSLMMFYGDFGRDYLAAREMLITGTIPLLGIPSSVVWLHQGPLSIYFIGLAFLLSDFNPIAPAIFYALLGVGTTFLVYVLGKSLWNTKVGLLASVFFATSPLTVMNARLPYHTAPIPFFTLLFILTLWNVLQRKFQFIFLLFFFLGVLLQLELSNAVLFFVTGFIWFFYQLPITKKYIFQAFLGLILGIIPFILHDITHTFIQIGGLTLWVINRIRLFLGLTIEGNATTAQAGSAIVTVWSEFVRTVSPASGAIAASLLVLCISMVYLYRKDFLNRKIPSGVVLVALWLLIPVLGFITHARPGTAYFPVLFPAAALLIAQSVYTVGKRFVWVLLLFFVFVIYNGYFLLTNNYFLATSSDTVIPKFYGYSYGIDLTMRKNAAEFIVQDANGRHMKISGGGYLSKMKTGVDNYKYLVLWKNGKLDNTAALRYTIYEEKKEVPPSDDVVFQNYFIYITKNENK